MSGTARARADRPNRPVQHAAPGHLHPAEASDLAASLIPGKSKRWRHSRSAAEGAAEAAQVLSSDESRLLVAVAWVHDIGYHHPDPPTGFHPLDGAELLLGAGWSARSAALVAHHSESRFMASPRGLLPALARWPREGGPVTDGLVYADMTAAPGGGRVGIRERLGDIRRRHVDEAPERAAARSLREPHLLLAAARVDVALRLGGFHGYPAFPSAHEDASPTSDAIEELLERHPALGPVDVEAALHACASPSAGPNLVVERAHLLLVAARSEP